ncbi:lytic transglycosylase [Paenibacillus montaniterrae]|uniref:Lytic transglycosylase n=1 Tax=Paenibacillus montaniterrae TaxID=429341 RepID=A0A919YL46_9BACL|nr:lytic transglycosylase domain-containing protein [Paenibacillus montaniterrae]GIP15465.1 lytic transglycosylase [Paenibacillus montaniterrae]
MKKKRMRRRLLLLIIIGIVTVLFIQSTWLSERLYPVKYQEIIAEKSNKYEVDPHLIAAVIRVESNFTTGRESPKGAIGLMQLMPTTAEWIVERTEMRAISSEELKFNPELNIELGTWYLKHLMEQFEGDMIISIAAYNAGPGNVNKWLSEKTWDGQYDTADQIPFGETRNYVHKVIYYYNKYKEIYPTLS